MLPIVTNWKYKTDVAQVCHQNSLIGVEQMERQKDTDWLS